MLIRDSQSRLNLRRNIEVLNLFRNRTPTIEGHKQRLVDLDRQISDAETDLQQAEAAAVDAALNATGLTAATDEVVRVTAALSALRAARTQIESELAAMRAKEAAEAFRLRSEAAEAVAQRVSKELGEIYDAIASRVERAVELTKAADIISGTFASQSLNGLGCVAVLKTASSLALDARFDDPNTVERIERLARDAKVLQ
jgi:hypothetical protein